MVGITAVRAVSNMQSVGFLKPVLFLRYADSDLGFLGFPLFSSYHCHRGAIYYEHYILNCAVLNIISSPYSHDMHFCVYIQICFFVSLIHFSKQFVKLCEYNTVQVRVVYTSDTRQLMV